MARRIYYNVHTHVFSKHCIPHGIMGSGFGLIIKALEFIQMNNFVIALLSGLKILNVSKSSIPRLKMFFRSFAQGHQHEVITHLVRDQYGKFAYDKNFKFVLLSLDMDAQDAGIAPVNYLNQVGELAEYKAIKPYKDQIIPFLSINPYNMIYHRFHMMKFIKDHIEVWKFGGIKLYPATGYYPDDERLDDVWKYCVAKKLPIMTHCTCGRIHYRGKMESRLNKDKIPYNNLTDSDRQCNFTDMSHFVKILERFPTLKICFAHAGGIVFSKNPRTTLEAELKVTPLSKRAIEYKWYLEVLECCQKYDNVYIDISWINHDEITLIELAKDVKARSIEKKVLYGTDFFVNIDIIEEQKAMENSQKHFDFDLIASVNPSIYLSSDIHEFKATEP